MAQYFDDPTVPSEPSTITARLRGRTVRLHTDRGVFSRTGLDAGTQVLLSEVPSPPPAGDLLDLGCGYGPIAAAMAFEAPRARVWAVDVNSRARALCERNCAELGLGNVTVCAPDDVPASVRFAAVWSNPPIRIGKAAVHEMLGRWLGRLADDAVAYLVVQKNLGSDSLQSWLTASGWPTLRRTSRRAFRVLEVSAQSTPESAPDKVADPRPH
jgi:16S rRNA (guanine1207-N2)-methyltransferase